MHNLVNTFNGDDLWSKTKLLNLDLKRLEAHITGSIGQYYEYQVVYFSIIK